MRKTAAILALLFALSACSSGKANNPAESENLLSTGTSAVTPVSESRETVKEKKSEKREANEISDQTEQKPKASIAKRTQKSSETMDAVSGPTPEEETSAAETAKASEASKTSEAPETSAESVASAEESQKEPEYKEEKIGTLRYEIPEAWTAEGEEQMRLYYYGPEAKDRLKGFAVFSFYDIKTTASEEQLKQVDMAAVLETGIQGMMTADGVQLDGKKKIEMFEQPAFLLDLSVGQDDAPVRFKGKGIVAVKDYGLMAMMMFGSNVSPFDQAVFDHIKTSLETLNP